MKKGDGGAGDTLFRTFSIFYRSSIYKV